MSLQHIHFEQMNGNFIISGDKLHVTSNSTNSYVQLTKLLAEGFYFEFKYIDYSSGTSYPMSFKHKSLATGLTYQVSQGVLVRGGIAKHYKLGTTDGDIVAIDKGVDIAVYHSMVDSTIVHYDITNSKEITRYPLSEFDNPLNEYYLISGRGGSGGWVEAEYNFGTKPFLWYPDSLREEGVVPLDFDNAHPDNIRNDYSLVLNGGFIQTYDVESNRWVDTNLTKPLTQAEFEEYGMSDLNIIPPEKWDELDNEFEIITWTDDMVGGKFVEITTYPFSLMEKLNREEEFEVLTWSNRAEEIPTINTGVESTIDEGKLFRMTLGEFDTIDSVEFI